MLDAEGAMVADRVRVPTSYPLPPDKFIDMVTRLVAPLPTAERASVGFPGMVRDGLVLSAPHFSTEMGRAAPPITIWPSSWSRFPLADALDEGVRGADQGGQ